MHRLEEVDEALHKARPVRRRLVTPAEQQDDRAWVACAAIQETFAASAAAMGRMAEEVSLQLKLKLPDVLEKTCHNVDNCLEAPKSPISQTLAASMFGVGRSYLPGANLSVNHSLFKLKRTLLGVPGLPRQWGADNPKLSSRIAPEEGPSTIRRREGIPTPPLKRLVEVVDS
eukprot:5608635-Amphidinium_carterae.1